MHEFVIPHFLECTAAANAKGNTMLVSSRFTPSEKVTLSDMVAKKQSRWNRAIFELIRKFPTRIFMCLNVNWKGNIFRVVSVDGQRFD